MFRLLLLLLIVFGICFLYGLIMKSYFKSKLILYLPSLVGVGWVIYGIISLLSNNLTGFGDIILALMVIIVFIGISGNIRGVSYIKKDELE